MSKSAQSSKTTKKSLKKPRKPLHVRVVKKKPYVEFITAFLSIPVLLTVILLNINAIKNLTARPTPTPQTFQNGNSFYAAPIGPATNATPTGFSGIQTPCKRGLGPVDISSPKENDVMTENPVIINISYDDSTYCGAAWSYRINGSSWSGYDDRSVALYNLPQGPVTLELRVKSIVTADEQNITRRFTYNGKGTVILPTSPNGTDSAN